MNIWTYSRFKDYIQELFMVARWDSGKQIQYLKDLYYNDTGNYHWRTLKEYSSRILKEEFNVTVMEIPVVELVE